MSGKEGPLRIPHWQNGKGRTHFWSRLAPGGIDAQFCERVYPFHHNVGRFGKSDHRVETRFFLGRAWHSNTLPCSLSRRTIALGHSCWLPVVLRSNPGVSRPRRRAASLHPAMVSLCGYWIDNCALRAFRMAGDSSHDSRTRAVANPEYPNDRTGVGESPLLSTVLLGTFLHYQIGVVGGGFGNATSRIHSDLDTKRFPVASACFLRSQGLEGRAFTLPNWGGYLLWKTNSRVKVLADGRGKLYPEVAAALNQIYNHRWQSMEWEKTRTSFTQFDALDMLVIQEPALPEGKRLEGWVRIFPPDGPGSMTSSFRRLSHCLEKGPSISRTNARRRSAHHAKPKSLAGQGGMPPAEWMHFLVGEGFCR